MRANRDFLDRVGPWTVFISPIERKARADLNKPAENTSGGSGSAHAMQGSYLGLLSSVGFPAVSLNTLLGCNESNPANYEHKKVSTGISFKSLPPQALLDSRLSAASTIRKFVNALGDESEKSVLSEIVTNAHFVNLFLRQSPRSSAILLNEDILIDPATCEPRINPDRLNHLLLKLSAKVHVEDSLPHFVLKVENNRLSIGQNLEGGNYELSVVSEADVNLFLSLVKGEETYRSLCHDDIKNVVILTHNRDLISSAVDDWTKNFSDTEHDVTLHIFDTSDDGKQDARRKEIMGSPDTRETTINGIKVRYFGDKEREEKLSSYLSVVERSGHFSGAEFAEFKKRAESAFSTVNRGVGVNRNWVALEFGDDLVLTIDDDVSPYVDAQINEEEARFSPDVLTAHARAFLSEGLGAACVFHPNDADTIMLANIEKWLQGNRQFGVDNKAHPQTFGSSRYLFKEGGYAEATEAEQELYAEQGFAYFPMQGGLKGGALTLDFSDPSVRVPCPSKYQSFRVEDSILDAIIPYVDNLLSSPRVPYKTITVPGGLNHERQLSSNFASMAELALMECAGTTLVPGPINAALRSIQVFSMMAGRPVSADEIMGKTGEALSFLLASGDDMLNPGVIDSGIVEIFEDWLAKLLSFRADINAVAESDRVDSEKEFLRGFDGFLLNFVNAGELATAYGSYNPNYEAQASMLMQNAAFKQWLNQRIKNELKIYADTLSTWDTLTKVADVFNSI